MPAWRLRKLHRPGLEHLIAHEVPHLNPQGKIFLRFAVIAGAVELGNADISLDPARASRENDQPRREIDRLVDVMRDEERSLAGTRPDRLQLLLQQLARL